MHLKNGIGRAALLALLAVTAAATALAAGPRVWVVAGTEQLREGEAVSVTLGADGSVHLAPTLDALADLPEPRIWSTTTGGGATFVASGERGQVMRIRGDEEPAVVFAADEIGAQALAWGPDGHLYVATGPDGAIYRIPADHDGSIPDPWFTPGTTYVWDMLFDPEGRLYLATGGDGRIVRVAPDATSEILYDSPETHVTALTLDGEGNLYAGTEGEGLVYRIAPSGDVFVLHDSDLREITDLVMVDGRLWVSSFGAPTTPAEVSTDRPAARTLAAGAGAVHAIEPDGYARRLWSDEASGVYRLVPRGDGVLAGTGPDGQLMSIGPDGETALLARTDAGQVVGLDVEGERILVATSNPGRLLALGTRVRGEGTYLSAVRDAGTIAHWGAIRWHATTVDGATVEISTRSGNTGKPDDTWSAWSMPYAADTGSAVASPPARFLQWRAILRSSPAGISPRLFRAEIAYVTRNLPPSIDGLTVHPAGVVYRQNTSFEDGLPFAELPQRVARELREADPASVPSTGRGFLGRAFFVPGQQTFTWEASDPNDDSLRFVIEYRGEADGVWRPLAGPVVEQQYVLDTRRLPDGMYLVRLTADDGVTQASDDVLSDVRVGGVFRVDNTPPVLELSLAEESGARVVVGTVQDQTSLIESLQYSVDGGEWRTVVPADGVADSAHERVRIVMGELPEGEHVVVVRAMDSALNQGAGRVVWGRR